MSTIALIHQSTPPPHAGTHALQCLPQDAVAIMRVLAHAAVTREHPGSADDRYLDEPISKPWGFEYRIYDDALVDVWMLQIAKGMRTSMHCHPRKDTVLLCVQGRGEIISGSARRIPIRRGSVVRIDQGAAHRSSATTDMTLVEIEIPRDKFDLVRLEDENGRAGRPYENAGHIRRRLHALEPVLGGPPRARLRPRCATGDHRFDLERGAEIQRRPDGLVFAISLDPLSILRRHPAVSRPEAPRPIVREHTYLTIRSTHEEDSA